jgi:biotin synthase
VKLIQDILSQQELSKSDLIQLLQIKNHEELELLRETAYQTMKSNVGEEVYLRGLVEFSNICVNDCFYCGIRKSNDEVKRYILPKNDILEAAIWCAEKGYGSIVLQSGERSDENFVSFVEDCVYEIKDKTKSALLPNGLGITLSIGELTYKQYERLFAAGAHRYLLRIETSNPELFKAIHPEKQLFEKRLECLKMIKEVGYHLGTGVMIGLPNQSLSDLAQDLYFFKELDIDMLGMGPYIVHLSTPMNVYKDYYFENQKEIYALSIKMIASARLLMKEINIASTTALQAIYPWGREEGLRYGANVVMPNLTPNENRKEYVLYNNKPCLEDFKGDCFACVMSRIESIGRKVGLNKWGDSQHFIKKRQVVQ